MSVTFTWPNLGVRQLFQAEIDGLNSGFCSVGCFSSPTLIGDSTSLGNLTPYTASGFGLQEATFTSAGLNGTGTVATASSGVSTFALTATISPVTIQGVYYQYTDTALGTELIAVALLPNGPLVISQIGDNVVSQLTLTDQRATGQP